MKKYLFYIILAFIMIFGFNSVVSAKTAKGFCTYQLIGEAENNYKQFLRMVLYDDGTATLMHGDKNPINATTEISRLTVPPSWENIIKDIIEKGECPQFFGIKKSGTNIDNWELPSTAEAWNKFDVTYLLYPFDSYSYFVDTKDKSCSYYITYPKAKFNLYKCSFKDDKVNCTLYNTNGGSQNYEDPLNSTDINKWYFANKKCPRYITFYQRGAAVDGYQVWMYDNYSDAQATKVSQSKWLTDANDVNFVEVYEADQYVSSAYTTYIPEDERVKEMLDNYIEHFSHIGKDSDLDKYCAYDNGNYRPKTAYENIGETDRTMCLDSMTAEKKLVAEMQEYVINAIADGKIEKTDERVKEFEKLSNNILQSMYGEFADTVDIMEEVEKIESDRDREDRGGTVKTCTGLIGPNTLILLKKFRNLIMIVGPILALVLGSYDLIVAVANGEEESKKKAFKKVKGRLIAAALLLLIPYILNLLLNIVNGIGKSCV